MKSKIWLFALVFSALFSLNSCKSKPSNYKAAYEKAQEKEAKENATTAPVEEVTPVSKPKTTTTTNGTNYSNASTQKEKVTAVDGTGLRSFSVVIGSFMNKTNATSLRDRMKAQGYNVIIAQNEKQMYRVIVASFDNKSDAAIERDNFKAKYSPDFQDAWLLEQQ